MTFQRFPRSRAPRRHSGSLKPILGILTAVLAVQAYQHWGMPAWPEDGARGWADNPSFVEGVLSLSGVDAESGSGDGWPLAGLFSIQSPALRQAAEVMSLESLNGAADPGPADIPPSESSHTPGPAAAAPPDGSEIPGSTDAALPSSTPPSSDVPAVSAENGLESGVIDPYTAWIGGPYSPPPADHPEAERLIEVTLLPSSGSGYDNNGTVFLKNKLTDPLDIAKIMSRPSILKPSQGEEPQILIVHTHGSESYFPDERDYYVPSDIQRTEDTRFNIVRVGERIAEGLRAQGLNVLHDKTICDSPSYTGSYTKSLGIIQQHIQENPSIQMVIDVHRDSLVSENGTAYKAVSTTEKGKAAQMMFVMGSNLNGLEHPHWLDNLNLACQMQQAALEQYPTLMRPMTLRKERYNQHASPGSCILEVGTAWNTLQEALLAADLFCETAGPVLAERLLGS